MNRAPGSLPAAGHVTPTMRTMNARRAAAIWLGLAVIALAVLVASLALGSVPLAPSRVLAALMPWHAGPARA
ncbi:iron ABC transporter permease, partial [Paraburkholderia sp. Ac-20336]|nr:iron ABC transporter permease [Paraburkholderia sp. Ac-20336]